MQLLATVCVLHIVLNGVSEHLIVALHKLREDVERQAEAAQDSASRASTPPPPLDGLSSPAQVTRATAQGIQPAAPAALDALTSRSFLTVPPSPAPGC